MMDKKRLRNIIRPAAKAEYFSQARTSSDFQYLAELKQFGDILQIAFFPTNSLREGREGADARIFVSGDDYITQDLKTAKTKWLKGRVDTVTHYEWNYRKPWLGNIGFTDEESRRIFVERFGDTESPRCSSPWPNFYNWQTKVLERKRKERYDRELTETEKYMNLIGELPESYHGWTKTVGMNQAAYLIYDAKSKKKEKRVFCTVCQEYHVVDANKMILRNYEKGVCPECGAKVEYRSAGRVPSYLHKDCWLCVIQTAPGGFVARYFSTHFQYWFTNIGETGLYAWKMSMSDFEMCRDFYIGKTFKSFEYRTYKQLKLRWCPGIGKITCGMAILYTKNIRDVLRNTPYQYCAIDVLQEKSGYKGIPVFRYLNDYPQAPCLEYFVKTGLVRLTTDIVRYSTGKYINLKEKDKRKIINLPAPYIRQLIRLNGNLTTINLLAAFALKDHNHPPKDEFIKEWQKAFGGGGEYIVAAENAGIPLPRFLRYIQKQRKNYTAKERMTCGHGRIYGSSPKEMRYYRECTNIAIDWRDYVGFCRQLKINLNDEHNLLPPNLKQAHDRMDEELRRRKDEKERKERECQEKEVNQILKNMQTDNPYEMTYKGLFIMVPRNTDDIRREGELQHHCVATYIDRVVKGETMILFVRQETAPEEPFYTLEYKDGRVAQCRGKRNCAMTAKVETFVKAFEKMMRRKEYCQVRIRAGGI